MGEITTVGIDQAVRRGGTRRGPRAGSGRARAAGGAAPSWSDVELRHAMLTDPDDGYGEKAVLRLANGRQLRCPAHPQECSYVRVVDQGHELAYWNSDEWRNAPEEVIGALLGCAMGGPQDSTLEALKVLEYQSASALGIRPGGALPDTRIGRALQQSREAIAAQDPDWFGEAVCATPVATAMRNG